MKNIMIFILLVGFMMMCFIALRPTHRNCDSYLGEVIKDGNSMYCEINIREEGAEL